MFHSFEANNPPFLKCCFRTWHSVLKPSCLVDLLPGDVQACFQGQVGRLESEPLNKNKKSTPLVLTLRKKCQLVVDMLDSQKACSTSQILANTWAKWKIKKKLSFQVILRIPHFKLFETYPNSISGYCSNTAVCYLMLNIKCSSPEAWKMSSQIKHVVSLGSLKVLKKKGHSWFAKRLQTAITSENSEDFNSFHHFYLKFSQSKPSHPSQKEEASSVTFPLSNLQCASLSLLRPSLWGISLWIPFGSRGGLDQDPGPDIGSSRILVGKKPRFFLQQTAMKKDMPDMLRESWKLELIFVGWFQDVETELS